MNHTFSVWQQRVSQDRISHTHAVALGHYTVGRGHRTRLTQAQIQSLWWTIAQRKPPADEPSTQRGLEWLQGLAYTPVRREIRRRCPFNAPALAVLDRAEAILLVGFEGGKPIYRVLSEGDWAFEYQVGTTAAERMVLRSSGSPITLFHGGRPFPLGSEAPGYPPGRSPYDR
jgi:hypothetical protein